MENKQDYCQPALDVVSIMEQDIVRTSTGTGSDTDTEHPGDITGELPN